MEKSTCSICIQPISRLGSQKPKSIDRSITTSRAKINDFLNRVAPKGPVKKIVKKEKKTLDFSLWRNRVTTHTHNFLLRYFFHFGPL